MVEKIGEFKKILLFTMAIAFITCSGDKHDDVKIGMSESEVKKMLGIPIKTELVDKSLLIRENESIDFGKGNKVKKMVYKDENDVIINLYFNEKGKLVHIIYEKQYLYYSED